MAHVSNAKKPVMASGLVLIAMGFVFLLQSQGTVGPETSFMYTNPEWDVNGKAIMLAGGIMCIGIIFVHLNTKRKNKKSNKS